MNSAKMFEIVSTDAAFFAMALLLHVPQHRSIGSQGSRWTNATPMEAAPIVELSSLAAILTKCASQ
jgi:hypothetical protein